MVDGQLVIVNGAVGALMELADLSTYKILRSPINMGKLPVELGGMLYFARASGVVEYNPGTATFRMVTSASLDLGEPWGMHARAGRIVVVSAYGMVVELDPSSSAADIHDLVQLGAPVGAQLAMSIAAGGGSVYVGGTNAVARHDLVAGTVRNINGTAEAKDMVLANGLLYTAQYSGKGIMGYDPAGNASNLHKLAPLSAGQNRPHDALWDPERARLYVGSGSDANVYGELTVFDPATSAIESSHADPFGDKQQVRTIAQQGSTLFLGGEAVGRSQVLAWDLETQAELWRVTFDDAPDAVCGLVVHNGLLYVLGVKGKFSVVDIGSKTVVHSAKIPQLMPNWGSLSVIAGNVYAVTSNAFFRIAQNSFAPEVLVDDLAADWYGVPRVAVDEAGQVYAIKGRNLIRITGIGAPALDVTVISRCVAKKVLLQVRVVNQELAPIEVEIKTAFGSRTFSGVKTGQGVFHSFSTRKTDITAGEVQVITSSTDNPSLSGTSSVAYDISTCS